MKNKKHFNLLMEMDFLMTDQPYFIFGKTADPYEYKKR